VGSCPRVVCGLMAAGERTRRPDLRLDRIVVLVGLMGAGKTSIGRRLADRLGVPFVDADEEIEKAAGSSIEDIFAEHGEEAFRDGERKVIARLLEEQSGVLATGGGAFMDESTRSRIRDRGVSVWLRAELDVLVRRCRKRGGRPLLKGVDMRETLQKLIDRRYPVYAEADIVVDTGDAPHRVVIDQIVDALRDRAHPDAPEADAT
jgi:shikimate kinase